MSRSTMAVSLRELLTCIMVVLAVAFPCTSAKEIESVFDKVKEQFEGLQPRGKFCSGAAVGFVGSRLALSSAITAVKVTGIALAAYVYFVCSPNQTKWRSTRLTWISLHIVLSQYRASPIRWGVGRLAQSFGGAERHVSRHERHSCETR